MNDMGLTPGDAAVVINSETNKRNADHLSPTLGDINRRYKWDTQQLLQENRYYPLQNQVSDANSLPSTSTNEPGPSTSQPSEPKIKIPPIFLPTSNYKEVTSDLKKIVKNAFTTSSTQNKLKINLTTIDDYRTVSKLYSDNNINFYTYQDPTSRPLSVVIKNIPVSLTDDEIKEELITYNLPIQKITRLLNKNHQPTLVVAVELTNNDAGKNIFKVDKICHAIIRIEPRKNNKNIPQCYRCQRFGHTRNYCNMEYRCVKCLGNHYYKDCPKAPNVPPTCVNCKENHPANFRGCTFFKNLQKSTNKIPPVQRRPEDTTIPTSQPRTTFTNPTISYANATRNTENNFPNNPFANSSTIEQIMSILLNLIAPHLETIKTFILAHILPAFLHGAR